MNKLHLMRSDLGDGGWSLHVRRPDIDEDEDPARAWPIVASGESGRDETGDGGWTRPDANDYAAARAKAAELAARWEDPRPDGDFPPDSERTQRADYEMELEAERRLQRELGEID